MEEFTKLLKKLMDENMLFDKNSLNSDIRICQFMNLVVGHL
jgi:hypothetical protein